MNRYTIFATLGNDLERIIEADFLDRNELKIVESVLVPMFEACDAYRELYNSMSDEEWFNYEMKEGSIDTPFPYPYFIFDNNKHKDLIALLLISGIGICLPLSDIPNIFERDDTINLFGEDRNEVD